MDAAVGQSGLTGVSAPQSTGAYVLNLETGQIIPAGPINSPSEAPESAWSPDSTLLALAHLPDANGAGGGLQVAGTVDGSTRQVASGGSASRLRWSPDGSQLAFIWSDAPGAPQPSLPSLKIWSMSNGSVRTLVPSGATLVDWVPDGSGITVAIIPAGDGGDYSNARIVTLDPQTGNEISTVLKGDTVVCQIGMAWSSDSRYLAYGGSGFHQGCLPDVSLGLWAWNRSSGMTAHLFDGTAAAPVWMADGRALDAVAQTGGPAGRGQISLIAFAPDGSGQQTVVSPLPTFGLDSVQFETASNVVMYRDQGCDRSSAWVVTPGAQPRNATSPVNVAYRPTLSPDGSTIGFSSSGSQGAYLGLSPVAGGPMSMPLTGGAMLVPGQFSPDGAWIEFSILSEWPLLCIP
jgi:Tol biopolymer transport system component